MMPKERESVSPKVKKSGIEKGGKPTPEVESEQEIRKLLTGSNWHAGLQFYDYLRSIKFRRDGTGNVLYGSNQSMKLDVDFRYTLLGNGKMKLEYLSSEDKPWWLRYEPTEETKQKIVTFALAEGPFDIDGPYNIKSKWDWALGFNESPFPHESEKSPLASPFNISDPNSENENLNIFFGHEKRKQKPILKEHSEEGYWLHRVITPKIFKKVKGYDAYKNSSDEAIIEQMLVSGGMGTDYEIDSDLTKKIHVLHDVFTAVAYQNMNPFEQNRLSRYASFYLNREKREIEVTDQVVEDIRWIWKTLKLKNPRSKKRAVSSKDIQSLLSGKGL